MVIQGITQMAYVPWYRQDWDIKCKLVKFFERALLYWAFWAIKVFKKPKKIHSATLTH